MVDPNDGRWHAGIGDPTVVGWITVGAYATAAVLCALCARGERSGSRRRNFWAALAAVMLLLCINKQLDLQTWFTEIGRDMARAQGWYDIRQFVQAVFILLLAGLGVAGMAWLCGVLRELGREVRWAVVGVGFLVVFVLMRASSFHHFDFLIGLKIGGWLKVNAVLELSGIGCIAWAAWQRLRSLGRRPHRIERTGIRR